MTEQAPQPGKEPPNPPTMKSAAPASAIPETSKQFLNTVVTFITTTAVRLRPTAIALLGTIATLSQQGKQRLETQEETASRQGKTVAPIDWTPVKSLANRFWTTVRPLWQKILVAARPRLPQSFQPLDDRALSGIFAGVLLLILWFFSALPSGQAAQPPSRPERSPYARTYSKRPPSPQPVTRDNQRDNQYDSQSMPIADLSSPPQTTVRPQPQPKPITPPPIAAVSQPSPQNSPIAQPEILNPEASRRLKLRQDLELIANALVPQSIVGIRPNDRSKSLTITLSDAWYRSSEDTQTNLSNSLLVISQGQGYGRLQLEDTEGTIVARNPVVGDGMIVVQRSR